MGLTHWTLITDPREKYQAYLCSEEWGKLRLAVRLRSHGKCERCGLGDVAHTHHLTYVRRFKEELLDLVGLCEVCHNIVHGWQGKRTLTSDDKMLLIKASEVARMRNDALNEALKHVEPIVETWREMVQQYRDSEGMIMSRTSDKKGHKCPRPGCNGFCSTGKVGHAGKETRRKRVCRVCGAYGPTKEINMPGWVFPLFDDAGPVKKHRAVKVPAAK